MVEGDRSVFVRFVPAEIEGVVGVSAVVIYSDRIVFERDGEATTYFFRGFARRQEDLLVRLAKRLFGIKPDPLLIGEREWCTDRRYVRLFTNPPVKIYTPPDHDRGYGETYIARINEVLRQGGYATFD